MSEATHSPVQEFEYKAEMKQLLHLIIHSLYTHPEVFLRELISNASDALNKVRFMQVRNMTVLHPEAELRITIELDEKNHTIAIEDSGIGMTREDLIERIGTVASSGTLEFLTRNKNDGGTFDGGELIGKFGVGFYSVFMVTDEVTIETRPASGDEKGWRWRSRGEGRFTIEEMNKPSRGTRIFFTLKDEAKELANEYRIKDLIKKYSNFVDFPIFIGTDRVNSVSALWQRKKEDLKKEEIDEFYKFIAGDFREPMDSLALHIEGRVNFKALVFVPAEAPFGYFDPREEKSLHLYVNRVFIQDDCKDLVPEYLRFLKGVVDTEDLPLNVSREVTQSSPVTTRIREIITNRVLGMLEEWAKTDAAKYTTFFTRFGNYLKLGLGSDIAQRERLTELMRFETSKTDAAVFTSFRDYVTAMDASQKEIYYLTGENRAAVEKNPNLEYFRKNNIEVIFLTGPVDLFTITALDEYDGKKIVSIEKADIDITKSTDTEADDALKGRAAKDILIRCKEILGDRVEDVLESKRLVDSVATLVVGKSGMDAQTERMMKMMDSSFTGGKKILEVNLRHPLMKNLARLNAADRESAELVAAVEQMYEGALLIEDNLTNPADFVRRAMEFMEKATRV
ncbi:MAG: molecular chaperone HtpG [Bacteroidota bacterium]|jgi:molecular chaperone HtpG|nr:molecular chaperone HtpG [Bacteroidota bacterium]